MALTRVSPALFQVSNNITSVTVGGSANTISLTFDSNGVITGASNNALSVANTLITGNIISSQIAPSVTLYGNPTVTSGNLTVGGSTSLGTSSASGNTTIYQAPGSSFLIMNVNGTLAGARRNWAINPEYDVAGGLSFSVGASEGAVPSTPRLIIKQQGALVLSNGSTSVDGTGITFPATQSASSDANTLDDYEEGTWTPAITFGSGGSTGITYGNRQGVYTKVGQLVNAYCYVNFTNKGSSTGQIHIGGFPFGNGGTNPYGYACVSAWATTVTGISGSLIGYMGPAGSTSVDLLYLQTGSQQGLTDANCTNSSEFMLNLTYKAI